MSRSEHEPDHVVTSRDVYDHSVEQYLEAVGSTIPPEFETPTDVAVLTAFAQDAAALSPGPVVDAGCGPAGENDVVERADAYESSSILTLHRHRVDDVIRSLDHAGFEVLVDVRRTAALDHETTPQAILVAHRRQD